MGHLHYHPDGLIYVRTAGATYVAAPDAYETDRTAAGLAALPTLPAGLIEVLIEPGGRVYATTAAWEQVGAPAAWVAYAPLALAAAESLVQAQAARSAG